MSGRLRLAPFPAHAQTVHDLLRTRTSAGLELDSNAIIRVTEPRVASLLGYPPKELLGRPLIDLVFSEDVELVNDLLVHNGPSTPSVEVRFNRRQRTRPVALEISMVSGSSGTRVHMQDVLSWRVVELALRGHSRLGHAMVDNTPSLILRLDQQCRAIQSNAAWVEVSGIEQTAETGLVWLTALDERTLEAFRAALPLLCTGQSFATTAYIRHSGGYVSKFELAIAPVVEAERNFAGFVVIGCDLGPLSEAELVTVAATVMFASSAPVDSTKPTPPAMVTTSPQPTNDLAVSHRPTEPVAANPDPMMKMALASVLAAARTSYVAPGRKETIHVEVFADKSDNVTQESPPRIVWQPDTPADFVVESLLAPELPAPVVPSALVGQTIPQQPQKFPDPDLSAPELGSSIPRGMAEYQTALAAAEDARRTALLAEAERIAATERSKEQHDHFIAAQAELARIEAEQAEMEARVEEARAKAKAEAARVESAREAARHDRELEHARLEAAKLARETAAADAAEAEASERRSAEKARQAALAASLAEEHRPVINDLVTVPSAFVDSRVRTGILEHLETYRDDGKGENVTVGLVFIDVVDTGSQRRGDRQYDLTILERRLRTAVRGHEFAAPLGDQGFVVAARGTFAAGDLEALVQRLVVQLTMPLRGKGGSSCAPQVCVGGVCSAPNESDVELVLRAELARAKAIAAGPGNIVLL